MNENWVQQVCLLPGNYTQLPCSLNPWRLGCISELSAGSDPNRSASANASLCSRLSMLAFFLFLYFLWRILAFP